MKILLLNPNSESIQPAAALIEQRGWTVLSASQPEEAWQIAKLHGASLDLFIAHREGADQSSDTPGLRWIEKVKSDEILREIPWILTSSVWDENQFAAHQRGPMGANAYLRFPFQAKELVEIIGNILGSSGKSQMGMNLVGSPPPYLPNGEKSGVTLVADAGHDLIEKNDGDNARISGGDQATLVGIPQDPLELKIHEPTLPTATMESPGFGGEDEFALETIQLEAPVDLHSKNSPASSSEGQFILESPTQIGSLESLNLESEASGMITPEAPTQIGSLVIPGADQGDLQALTPEAPTQIGSLISSDAGQGFLESPTQIGALDSLDLESSSEGTLMGVGAGAPLELNPLEDSQQQDLSASASDDGFFELPQPPELERVENETLLRELPTAQSEIPALGEEAPVFRTEPPRRKQDQEAEDHELSHEMPYLFKRSGERPLGQTRPEPIHSTLPLGDAVIPGGAVQSPDLETLKKYLDLREQDVAALSARLRATENKLDQMDMNHKLEQARAAELELLVQEQKIQLKDVERDKKLALDTCYSELQEMRFQMHMKEDRVRSVEAKLKDATEEMERLKERVRKDIRRIRVREMELENRLEIMKKDAESLIASRESRIIELKRKLDTVEFNLDILQDKYNKEKESSAVLRVRLAKAAQAVRAAGGLLDSSSSEGASSGVEESNRSKQEAS